jgi:hypothetical protein
VCHPAQLPVESLLADCQLQRSRGSGPGGQHRNKVETAVVVEHTPTGLRGEASERRSQLQNRQQAIHRLRVKLALELRHPPATAPSALWQSRVTGKRLSVSATHDDFPALLAEALDTLDAQSYALPDTAQWLALSTSQLVKFLKVEPAALAAVNRHRRVLGQPPLR